MALSLSSLKFRRGRLLLFTLAFFSLFCLSNCRLDLDPADFKALSVVLTSLGVNGQRQLPTNLCAVSGVFCERRLSENSTYVLKVTRLVFKSQDLAGFLLPAIGRLSNLKELSLPNNHLIRHLPPQIVDCSKLEIVDLQNNQFSGEIPSDLSSLIRLRVLDLSFNNFSGKLNFLQHFPNLERLSLASNLFFGKIPESIRSFRNLQFLDLSGNDLLEGSVPLLDRIQESVSAAARLPKRYRLSENRTATGSRNRTSSVSAAPAPAPSSVVSNSNHSNKSDHRRAKILGWILGFLAGAVAGCLFGLVFSVMFKLTMAAIRGGGKDSGPVIFSPVIKKSEDLAFLEKEDGLNSCESIGKGGCGEVYKVELPCSGKIVAIKKITQPLKEAAAAAADLSEENTKLLNKKMRQIRSEIATVGQIRHRNLLPLLAHVPRPDCHYLVYEFMKNGSLHDYLIQVSKGDRELDWPARHKIAFGVAAGLEYLHVLNTPRIIHRDLKPANVLLDDNMEARIADFGLAKAMPDAHTHITASNVAGTVGYIAPEYHQTLKFTDKCDIYSFGVLLAVLVMGKFPSGEFFQHTEEMSMIKWMRNVMTSETPTRAIDANLLGNVEEEGQMLLVLKIALLCTWDNPKERPNSKDVRCMLAQVKDPEK